MKKQSTQNIRLGIFVTVAIALFIAGIYYIGNQQNLFGTTYKISSSFSNVNGLQTGNNVRFNGISVGSVENIIIESDSTVRIMMALEEDMKNYVRSDATASIGSDGLVGNMIVNINPGAGNQPLVTNGGSIRSFSKLDPNEMLETLGSTNETIAILSLNLLKLTERLNEGQGTLPQLIRDEQMARNVQSSIRNLNQTSKNISLMSQQMQESVEGILNGKGTLGYLLKDTTLVQNLENLTTRLDSQLIVKTTPLLENLETSSIAIKEVSSELETMMETVNNGKGPVTTLLKDSTSSQDIQSIIKNVEESSVKFNENMKAMRHNFLFRRYFKKQDKARKKAEKKKKAVSAVVIMNE